jgi:hypothetical protein
MIVTNIKSLLLPENCQSVLWYFKATLHTRDALKFWQLDKITLDGVQIESILSLGLNIWREEMKRLDEDDTGNY